MVGISPINCTTIKPAFKGLEDDASDMLETMETLSKPDAFKNPDNISSAVELINKTKVPNPVKTTAAILGITSLSFLSAKGISNRVLNWLSDFKVADKLGKLVVSASDNIADKVGRMSGEAGFSKSFKKIAANGIKNINAFAEKGIDISNIKAEDLPVEKAKNAIVKTVSLVGGLFAGKQALEVAAKDKSGDGISDMFQDKVEAAARLVS